MLIYNFQKEFIGIDEKDLKILGFKNLGDLRMEVTDFADLFVKTPGFIHNFKHVHWIDFITCADSNEESKVIINVNNKNYKCILHITTAYLVDNPTAKSYIINLQNLRELSHKESQSIAGDIITREAPTVDQVSETIFNTPEHGDRFIPDNEDSFENTKTPETETSIVDDYDMQPLDLDSSTETLSVDTFDTQVDIPVAITVEDDLEAPLDISFDDDDDYEEKEIFDNQYIYNPSVASEELGLPLDLIEEFIEDFIEQSKEFKDDLYRSADEGDFDNIKILSHKLKGVAANLRIEDALEALTLTNTSSDLNEVIESLDTLYKIIAKLSGEEISVEKELLTPIVELQEKIMIEEEDLYSDPIEIQDSEVPDKIEIAELSDDTFLDEVQDEKLELILDVEDETFEVEPEISLLDADYSREVAAAEIGLDLESFNELFDDFTSETQTLITSMIEAIEKENFELCKAEAIKLRAMSNNMRISAYNDQIKILIDSNDTQKLNNAVKTVQTVFTQLVK